MKSARVARLDSVVVAVALIVMLAGLAALVASVWLRHDCRRDSSAAGLDARGVADAEICRANLEAVRALLRGWRITSYGRPYPPTLAGLGVPPSMLRCPVGKTPFVYDPASGSVRCAVRGHERH